MKAEKKGGNSTKMAIVKCSIWGMDMDCPESIRDDLEEAIRERGRGGGNGRN
ncbi:MAG: hypothetical protein O8C64_02860 [Candidatus Methanoperedens sp.]|nr:hypothetical protein [Candidatus Methanoperedens sp.]MCZ7406499.1 hypothetical protein [Candidatus Methanoperedens sp.]